MVVRQLTAADLAEYRALQRFGLSTQPEAFVDTLSQDAARTDADAAAPLARGEGWGVFRDGKLVGKLTMDHPPYESFVHTRWLHGVYVHPEARGTGASAALIEAAMASARTEGVTRFILWVNGENAPARRLYEKLGFRECGRVPGGILIDGRAADDVLMCL